MSLLRPLKFAVSVLFLAGLAFVCYRRPLPDDFDRYIYEAIVRGKSQPIEQVYAAVKHESPRAEGSTVLDSPQHLRELEPLYAIRPLYLRLISVLSAALPVQKAIDLISASSLFGVGLVLMLWTNNPVLSALLMAYYPILTLGRGGTPDALAALLALSALCLIDLYTAYIPALCILFVSLGVRTDTLLLLFCVLVWLVWKKKIPAYIGGVLAIAALGIVLAINHWAGNYGWIVLFRYSFIGGRYPALEPHTLSIREYLHALFAGASVILTRSALWIVLGVVAYLRRPSSLLLVTAAAAAGHFLLFPSGEDRYMVWAYIVTAVVFFQSLTGASTRSHAAWHPLPLASSDTSSVVQGQR